MGSAFLYLGIVLMWLCVLVPMWLRRDRHTVEMSELYGEQGMDGDPDVSDCDPIGGDTLADISVSDVAGVRTTGALDPSDDEITVELTSPTSDSATPGSSGTGGSASSGTGSGAFRPSGTGSGASGPSGAGGSGLSASSSGATGPGTPSGPRAKSEPSGPSETPLTEPSAGESSGPYGGGADPSQEESRRRARVLARRRRWLLCCGLVHLASGVTAAAGVAPWWSVAPSTVLLASYVVILRIATRVDRERRAAAARALAERQRKARERRRALEAAAQQAEAEIIEFVKPAEPFDQHADRSRRAVGD
ncbi:hypothetical protein [Sphaerisporangium fuscum]|uniref:hypothetical protein n=1 Tax=Sphaerisporangium fuscum TaxID=2835868 RepID=UPI001BDC8095|nr:hypothetical protein [Sphaerisporangium fuscum]